MASEFRSKAHIGFNGSATVGSTCIDERSRIETKHEHVDGARQAGGRSHLVNLVARFVSFG
jgi:hypothetical protein